MLYLFDIDGTIVTSYMINLDKAYHTWSVLPKRVERLHQLLADGHQLGFVTNQAGAAFGLIRERDFERKFAEMLRALGIETAPVAVCYGHPKARFPRYKDAAEVARRKPSGAMIRELVAQFPEAAADGVVFVGDMDSDVQAAWDAGVPYADQAEFFA